LSVWRYYVGRVSVTDGTDPAAALELARRFRAAASRVHGLAETAGRALDGVAYEGPAASRDRSRLAEAAAVLRRSAAGLDEVAAAIQRLAVALAGTLP